MKGINVTLSDKAHANLKAVTEATKRNQHEVISFILERIKPEKIIEEMQK